MHGNWSPNYGNCIHWDLWGPDFVTSLNRNSYAAACIIDANHETAIYFQKSKSETFASYHCDEAYIETQMGNMIKIVCSDRGEFLSKEMIKHQDDRGTTCELTIHDSPP